MRLRPVTELLESPTVRSGAASAAPAARVVHEAISIEITTAGRFASIGREWRDLVDRALEPNAFMEPGLVLAAELAGKGPIRVLLAWGAACADSSIRLLGAWAFGCHRSSSGLPVTVLKTPVHDHAYLGLPVLDRERGGQVLRQMLDEVSREPDLPKVIEIASLEEGGAFGRLFADCLAERRTSFIRLDPRLRPQLRLKAPRNAPPPLSASRVRALGRRRRHLASVGDVASTTHMAPSDVDAALDELLVLEGAGWKGRASRRGRAIRRDPLLEQFFRAAVSGLAAEGLATITALRCDGRPVAMQLTIRSGVTAFTWKSAYDEEFRSCAPGLLLLKDLTDVFWSDENLKMIDSCNHRDDGYMAEFWKDRRSVADILLDVRPRTTPVAWIICQAEVTRRWLLAKARQTRSRLRSSAPAVRQAVEAIFDRIRKARLVWPALTHQGVPGRRNGGW